MTTDIPTNLKEAIHTLISLLEATGEIQQFKNVESWELHHGLGRYIRNTWGLWTQSQLFVWFKEQYGITHPDDISSIIIVSTQRHLKGEDLRLEEQIQTYKDYWEKPENKL